MICSADSVYRLTWRLLLAGLVAFSHLQFSQIRGRQPYLIVRKILYVIREDDRRILSGIIHILKSGCRWKDYPEAYGPPTTIYSRCARWEGEKRWPAICGFRQADPKTGDHREGRPLAAIQACDYAAVSVGIFFTSAASSRSACQISYAACIRSQTPTPSPNSF